MFKKMKRAAAVMADPQKLIAEALQAGQKTIKLQLICGNMPTGNRRAGVLWRWRMPPHRRSEAALRLSADTRGEGRVPI